MKAFACREGCGACCVAPSINSPLPGMAQGKPAGVKCAQLTEDFKCSVFGLPERPSFCGSLRPHPEMCGESRGEAIQWLVKLEQLTKPG